MRLLTGVKKLIVHSKVDGLLGSIVVVFHDKYRVLVKMRCLVALMEPQKVVVFQLEHKAV